MGCQRDLRRPPPLSSSSLAPLLPGLLVPILREVSLGRMRPGLGEREGQSAEEEEALDGSPGPRPALGKHTGPGRPVLLLPGPLAQPVGRGALDAVLSSLGSLSGLVSDWPHVHIGNCP